MIWSTNGDPFGGDEKEFDYIGKIDLTIRTEKTGSELVGKVCEFSDDGIKWHFTEGRECNGYSESEGYSWGMQGRWFKYARLAR